MVGAEGYHNVQPEKAGWRYGFLASREDGSRVYGGTFSKSPGSAEFTVPANTKFLWLVVMGAPTEHWVHAGRRRFGGARDLRGGASTNAIAGANTIANDNPGGATNNANGNTNAIPNRGAMSGNANEQWPYRFKLTSTTPDDSVLR
jgi:hypothetical protein